MSRRTTVWLSDETEADLKELGTTVAVAVRVGIDALKAEQGLIIEEAALADPEVRAAIAAAKEPDAKSAPRRRSKTGYEQLAEQEAASGEAEEKRERRDRRASKTDCKHPRARVHKGLCGACGTGGL